MWHARFPISDYLSKIVWPIQSMIDSPFKAIGYYRSFWKGQENLILQNEELMKKQVYLEGQMLKFDALEAENKELHKLLRSTGSRNDTFTLARLLHVATNPAASQVILNKGSDQNIEVDQPVVDAQGLVGMVTKVSPHTADVLLINDSKFAVPIQCVRNGERAIAIGVGPGKDLRLNYVPYTADLKKGDELITSGVDGRFPGGYPVGTITDVKYDANTKFPLITVKPTAALNRLTNLLVVKPSPESLAKKSTAPIPATITNEIGECRFE